MHLIIFDYAVSKTIDFVFRNDLLPPSPIYMPLSILGLPECFDRILLLYISQSLTNFKNLNSLKNSKI